MSAGSGRDGSPGAQAGAQAPRVSECVPCCARVSTKGLKGEAEIEVAGEVSTWPSSGLTWGEDRGRLRRIRLKIPSGLATPVSRPAPRPQVWFLGFDPPPHSSGHTKEGNTRSLSPVQTKASQLHCCPRLGTATALWGPKGCPCSPKCTVCRTLRGCSAAQRNPKCPTEVWRKSAANLGRSSRRALHHPAFPLVKGLLRPHCKTPGCRLSRGPPKSEPQ